MKIDAKVAPSSATCYYDADYCGAFKKGWIGAGIAMAASGAVVLAVGAHKREPAAFEIKPNGVRWHVRF